MFGMSRNNVIWLIGEAIHRYDNDHLHIKCAICKKVGHAVDMEKFTAREWYNIWPTALPPSMFPEVLSGSRYAHAECLKEKGYERSTVPDGWQKKAKKEVMGSAKIGIIMGYPSGSFVVYPTVKPNGGVNIEGTEYGPKSQVTKMVKALMAKRKKAEE